MGKEESPHHHLLAASLEALGLGGHGAGIEETERRPFYHHHHSQQLLYHHGDEDE